MGLKLHEQKTIIEQLRERQERRRAAAERARLEAEYQARKEALEFIAMGILGAAVFVLGLAVYILVA